MYVTFPVSQRDLLQAQVSGRQSEIKDIKVKVRFANGSTYDQQGTINFIDVSVNRATDTVIARATIANPAGTLIDGQLVSVTLESRDPGRESGRSASSADRRSARHLSVRCRGRKGGGAAGQARGRERAECRDRRGLERRRAGDRRGAARRSSGIGGAGETSGESARTGAEPMLSSLFVDRPRLAIVIAIVTTIAGLLALYAIPFAQYPDIVPPQVSVTTAYPGANSAVVEATVAQVIEAQVVGVDKMIYMKSIERRRRQLHADRFVRARHQSGHQHGQRQQPRPGRVSKPSARGPAPGRDCQEEVVGAAWRDRRLFAEAYPRSAVPLQLRHHQPARPDQEHARRRRCRRCGARRTTRCAPGCEPIS